ncbi:cupin domain-containing protein [Paucibacter soli]|uniref:cupin domain-containing protein n=1 Tax=Paucibacter soli TaxID=3133433 RepID=UPI0030A3E3B1
MRPHALALVIAGSTSLAGAFLAGVAHGQADAPRETKGQTAAVLHSIDLTEEIDSVKGRPLRMRRITLQPGGVLGIHTHKDRPTVSYFLQGEVTYHQADKPDVVIHPGEGFAEGKATTHWAENRGTIPAVWIAVDIPKAP